MPALCEEMARARNSCQLRSRSNTRSSRSAGCSASSGGSVFSSTSARAAAVELERGDLVVEPRLVVGIAPADGGILDAGRARERAHDHPRRRGGHEAHHRPLLVVERVAERRARRLPRRRAHAGALRERDLGEVGVVDVARQRDDRGRRLAALARADRADDAHHALERLAERRPVLEVERPGAASRRSARRPAPTRRRTPPRSRPRGSASPARAAAAARCRSAGARSRRARAPRSTRHSSSSTMLRSPGSSTRPARESTITSRAGPMSRQ